MSVKQLDTMAAAALRRHKGSVNKALPDFVRAVQAAKLIDDLAREFLRQVAGRGEGHRGVEAQSTRAKPTPALGSVKVAAHDVRQHRRRTHAEKEAARLAAAGRIEAIFDDLQINGRAIGNIAIGELMALKRDLIDDASHKLMLGIEQARNAVLAELIEAHCVVQDTLVRVRDVVDAETLTELVKLADAEAPRRISEAMRRAAEAIDHKGIAA